MYNFIRNPTDGRASSLEMIKGYVVVGAQMRLTTLCKKGWGLMLPPGGYFSDYSNFNQLSESSWFPQWSPSAPFRGYFSENLLKQIKT